MSSRTRAVILPLCSALVGLQFKCCVQIGDPKFRKNMEGLENVRRRATRLGRGLEHKSCEKRQRELGLFILENRSSGRQGGARTTVNILHKEGDWALEFSKIPVGILGMPSPSQGGG